MIYDTSDVHSLALCAWKEARGESQPEGCLAVMNVIINRVGFPGFAHTLHDVIYGKNQFTSMSVPSDAEFNLQPTAVDPVWNLCTEEAQEILESTKGPRIPDITNDAHYYANLHYATSGWFYDNIVKRSDLHPITAQIGRHTFFK